jgi:hypothetical protein
MAYDQQLADALRENAELRQSLVALRTELTEAREALNSCCACQHDGRGTLTSECEHHQGERERAEHAEAERDTARKQRDELANFNPDWDMLAATQESLREHMNARTEAEQALAGLKVWLETERAMYENEQYDSAIELAQQSAKVLSDVIQRLTPEGTPSEQEPT